MKVKLLISHWLDQANLFYKFEESLNYSSLRVSHLICISWLLFKGYIILKAYIYNNKMKPL